MNCILIIISQIVFSFSRTLNIRYTVSNKIFMAILTSFLIKISWLIGSAISINSLLKNDWFSVFIYIISGLLGDYISLKIDIK